MPSNQSYTCICTFFRSLNQLQEVEKNKKLEKTTYVAYGLKEHNVREITVRNTIIDFLYYLFEKIRAKV